MVRVMGLKHIATVIDIPKSHGPQLKSSTQFTNRNSQRSPNFFIRPVAKAEEKREEETKYEMLLLFYCI